MMILTVYTTELGDNKYRVFWKKSLEADGIIDVTVLSVGVNKMIIAELEAIRYLFTEKNALSLNPQTTDGKGIELRISQKEIPFLLTKEGGIGKNETMYTHVMYTRLANIKLEVYEDKSWFDDDLVKIFTPDEIEITTPKYDILSTPNMGDIVITRNALEKFKQTSIEEQGIIPNRLWRSLVKRTRNETLIPSSMPKKYMRQRKERWGREAIIYGSTTDVYHYVTSESASQQGGAHYNVLTTVYVKRRWKKELESNTIEKQEVPYLCSSNQG